MLPKNLILSPLGFETHARLRSRVNIFTLNFVTMKNVIDFTNSSEMLKYFCTWRAKGRCIFGAYRFRGKKADYYITNVNFHATDFVIFVIAPGQRFSFSCEKRLIVGPFLCVLQFLQQRESTDVDFVSNPTRFADDLPF